MVKKSYDGWKKVFNILIPRKDKDGKSLGLVSE